MTSGDKAVTAAVLVIGDEILSGRTQDTNTNYIARFLGALGIDLKEVRVVADVEDEIVAALNALRARYTYVFTTGGIGPTHDDITADAVAKAFGVGIDYHPEAWRCWRRATPTRRSSTTCASAWRGFPHGGTRARTPSPPRRAFTSAMSS